MTYIPLPTDSVSTAAMVIDSRHHEIHEGDMYRYTDPVTLGAAASQDYLITTPNTTKWAHLLIEVDGTAITSFFMYEASDRTGTTLQAIYNANRNSANTATMTIRKGTSGGTTDGTLLWSYAGGAATNQSHTPTSLQSDEIVLKQNTKYLLRITSGTAGNLCNVGLQWYEHVSGE